MEESRKRRSKARTCEGSTLAEDLEEIGNRCKSRKKRIDVEVNRVRHGTRNGRTNVVKVIKKCKSSPFLGDVSWKTW